MHVLLRRAGPSSGSLLAIGIRRRAPAPTPRSVEVEQPRFNPRPGQRGRIPRLVRRPHQPDDVRQLPRQQPDRMERHRHAGAYATSPTTPGRAQPPVSVTNGLAESGTCTATGVPGGWNAVTDSVYHNVQCRAATARASCTSPTPTRPTFPSPAAAWTSAELVGPRIGCSACHAARSPVLGGMVAVGAREPAG